MVLLTVMVCVFTISLALLVKRKDFQPLKSRSVGLVFLSTLGNFLYFTFLMLNKIITNNYWGIWNGLNDDPGASTYPGTAIGAVCYFALL